MGEQAASEDVKSFLYAWLGRRKEGPPEYNLRPAGSKQRQRFMCELKVPGSYPYTACGNSTNKKDAQSNAARDFVQYLVRQGTMNSADVPNGILGQQQQQQPQGQGGNLGLTHRPVFQQGYGPESLGFAYRPAGGANQDDQPSGEMMDQMNFRQQFLDQRNKAMVAEAEDVDVNAGIHG